MKNYFALTILLILSIAGIYFIGEALTGFVIGESCCFGDNCKAENLCDSAKIKNIEQPKTFDEITNIYIGISLIILSVITYALMEYN